MARSLCLYGSTGSFKTAAVKDFAHYIADVTGKSTLLLSNDGGGWAACEPEVQAGMILPWRCETNHTPLSLMRKVSQGYWPSDTARINEAIAEMFASGKVNPEASLVPIDWARVGGLAVEGWTSISQVIMRFLPDKGINVGGENRTGNSNMSFTQGVVIDGNPVLESFGSNTRGDYGFVQNQLYSLVSNFNSLPCHSVMYTALESKTEDDDRSTIFGPAISGKKATRDCGAWVGDLLHAQDYTVPRTEMVVDPMDSSKQVAHTTMDVKVRIFYRKHPDPSTGILFPAKPRCAPGKIAELEKQFPGGFFEPTTEHGLDLYLHALDRLAADASQSDALKGWREKRDAQLGRKQP